MRRKEGYLLGLESGQQHMIGRESRRGHMSMVGRGHHPLDSPKKEGRGERTALERRDKREREAGDKEMRGEIFGL